MDYRKKIDNEKKFEDNKEKMKDIFTKISDGVQELADAGANKMNEIFNNSKSYAECKQKEYTQSLESYYKKSVYSDVISFVEKEIIKNNVKDKKTTYITKYACNENAETMSIEALIKNLSPSETISFDIQEYIPVLYHMLILHFNGENQIILESKEEVISLSLKDVEEQQEPVT